MGHSETFAIVTEFAKAGYEPVVYPIIPGSDLTSEELVADYGSSADVVINCGICGAKIDDGEPAYLALVKFCLFSMGVIAGTQIPDKHKKKAIRAAVKGKAFRYDVGRMNDRYFNYVAAFGAFSEISYDTDQGLKNVLGYAAYVLNAITRLPRDLGYGVSMKIKTDKASYEGQYVFGAVCNSVSVGGMKLFENADVQLDDGSMELLLIRSPKSLSDLNSVISSLATGNVDNPNISIHPVKTAVFHSDEDVSWTLDGEYGGSSCDTEISVIQRAMTIRIP